MERDALNGVERACQAGLGSRALRTEIAARLSRVIAYDAYCFATTDPHTLLLTDEVSHNIPVGGESVAAHNEYLVDDVDKFADLARSRRTVGVLGLSTGGEPGRSHRFRTVLPMLEAKDEMRIVFVTGQRCWGAISLFRGHDRTGFTPREAALARVAAPPIAAALRRAACRPRTLPDDLADPTGPGVLFFDHNDTLTITNEAAERWLEELSPHRIALHEVCAATRAGLGSSCLRFRSRAGRWLSLHGSTVSDGGVAVVVQPTPTSDIVRMLTLAHALTPREQQVLQCVIAGTPTSAIAAELRITASTVEAHLKSLFAKFGVAGRRQLVPQLIGEVYRL
uniref:helix-turn-helix transcriptional regulator n=1 Tax=Paractinoplanes polyasparticus TaxID=2856853 RepID=UPI001C861801|nr:helix-turn-helix transcriptional regulator [Actinoplanes polyasparticus]